MSKGKKKVAITKKEEEQAQKVVKNSVRLINYFGIDYADCIFLFRLISSPQITRSTQTVWLLIE